MNSVTKKLRRRAAWYAVGVWLGIAAGLVGVCLFGWFGAVPIGLALLLNHDAQLLRRRAHKSVTLARQAWH